MHGAQTLPGIELDRGVMLVDPDRLVSPGDLLHEAGHLAVMPPARRRVAGGRFDSAPAEELAAIAWSNAAAIRLALDTTLVFHEHGYRTGGGWIADAFAGGAVIGVPSLCWLGLTSHGSCGEAVAGATYPTMIAWLNQTEKDLSRP